MPKFGTPYTGQGGGRGGIIGRTPKVVTNPGNNLVKIMRNTGKVGKR